MAALLAASALSCPALAQTSSTLDPATGSVEFKVNDETSIKFAPQNLTDADCAGTDINTSPKAAAAMRFSKSKKIFEGCAFGTVSTTDPTTGIVTQTQQWAWFSLTGGGTSSASGGTTAQETCVSLGGTWDATATPPCTMNSQIICTNSGGTWNTTVTPAQCDYPTKTGLWAGYPKNHAVITYSCSSGGRYPIVTTWYAKTDSLGAPWMRSTNTNGGDSGWKQTEQISIGQATPNGVSLGCSTSGTDKFIPW